MVALPLRYYPHQNERRELTLVSDFHLVWVLSGRRLLLFYFRCFIFRSLDLVADFSNFFLAEVGLASTACG